MEDPEGLFDPDELAFLKSHPTIQNQEISSLDEDDLKFLGKAIQEEDHSSFGDSSLEQIASAPENIVRQIERMNATIDKIHREFPRVPEKEGDRLMHYLYYAALCCLFSEIKGEDFDWTPQPHDSEELLTEKAIGMYLDEMYRCFIKIAEFMGDYVFTKMEGAVYKRFPKGHPILELMQLINDHKELHSRRIKADPCLPRTKAEIASGHQSAMNIVTQEVYSEGCEEDLVVATPEEQARSQPWKLTPEEIAKLPETAKKHHSSWKMLIISPLPSDGDENAVDPVYRSQEEEMLHNIDVIQQVGEDVESYGIMVTDDWDKLLRTLHGACHLHLYLHDRMVECITPTQRREMSTLPWKVAWKRIAGPYANKRITELTGNKKAQPNVVVSLMELRDFVHFLSLFK